MENETSESNVDRNAVALIFIALLLLLGGIVFVLMKNNDTEIVQSSPSPSSPAEDPLRVSPTPQPQIAELQKIDLVEGIGGEATAGAKVTVHYTGTFQNGQKFDSSVDRGQPFSFVLGRGQVIKGWDLGVLGMKEGGKRKLLIPSTLAYGQQGSPGAIPPNTPLIFEIDLLKVE